MKPKLVGQYILGWDHVEIVFRNGMGGEFYLRPSNKHIKRISIGYEAEWGEVVAVFLHELFELTLETMGFRYLPSNNINKSHDDYAFFLTHIQFTEVVERCSECFLSAEKNLKSEWKKCKGGK